MGAVIERSNRSEPVGEWYARAEGEEYLRSFLKATNQKKNKKEAKNRAQYQGNRCKYREIGPIYRRI
jgi:hypothetical protein